MHGCLRMLLFFCPGVDQVLAKVDRGVILFVKLFQTERLQRQVELSRSMLEEVLLLVSFRRKIFTAF